MASKKGTARAKASQKTQATKSAAGATTPKALIWTLVAVTAVIVAFLVLKPSGASGGVINVNANGVLKAQQEGVRVIDVRSAGEYEAGHVPGAENVPIEQFAQAAQGWDRNAPVLVYCATGARSSQAVNILRQDGFKKVYHFEEGLQAWTGGLDSASTSSSSASVAAKPTARPVMYEFYTDW